MSLSSVQLRIRQAHNKWWRHQMETFFALLAYVRGIHRLPMDSPKKGQRRGALKFSLIPAWASRWGNIEHACNLRRYRAHGDVTLMKQLYPQMRHSWHALIDDYDTHNFFW